MAPGANDEAPPEERVRGIGHLDLVGLRVLEAGIKKWLLLIGSVTTGW
jgi:hypothetical protein